MRAGVTLSPARSLGGAAAMDTRASKRRGGERESGGTGAVVWGAGGSTAAVSLGGDGGGGQIAPPSDEPPGHQSPGYGAEYDAGFLAGLLAAAQGGAPPPPGPVAAEGGAVGGARPPLLALAEDFPDLFRKEVLERLDPVDRGMLGRTGSVVRTAVKVSDLPRVGGSAEAPRVGIGAFCESLTTFVWAVANGCPWQFAETCETLARGGHLEVLRWAREHGCEWDEDTCASAADAGQLEVLRWVREHGCPWDLHTCARAAGGGHLEVLKWARRVSTTARGRGQLMTTIQTVVHSLLLAGTWRC